MDHAIRLSLQSPAATVGAASHGPAAAVAPAMLESCKKDKIAAPLGTVSPMGDSVEQQPTADANNAVGDGGQKAEPVRKEGAQSISPDSFAVHLESSPKSVPAKRACTASR